jgi:hypothetical protein
MASRRHQIVGRGTQHRRLVDAARGGVPAGERVQRQHLDLDLANFIGYVLWSLWLVAFAVVLVRRPVAVPAPALPAG